MIRYHPEQALCAAVADAVEGAECMDGLSGYDAVAESGELFRRGEPEVGIGYPSNGQGNVVASRQRTR